MANDKLKAENKTLKHELKELLKRMMTDRREHENMRVKSEHLVKRLCRMYGSGHFSSDEEEVCCGDNHK